MVTGATLHMEKKNFVNFLPEMRLKGLAEETMLHQEGVMDKAMERQLVEEL